MKKTLFSLAFVAASGAYVAAANHLFAPPGDNNPLAATDAAIRMPSQEPAPAASITPLVAAPEPSHAESTTIAALAAPVVPTEPSSIEPAPSSVAPSSIEPAPLVAEAAPVALPPLPRPRPAPPAAALQSAASTTAATNNTGLKDGTYTGDSENAYYGRVQVQVTIANHRIAAIKVLDYPKDRRTSRYINSQALPLLREEVVSASSANVDTVSGATLTSEAYLRSLDNALSQAGGASA